MNPFDFDERLREVDEAETRHESEETTRRALRSPPEDEMTDEEPADEEPADD
jgi:hypothetical protein